LKEKFFIKKVLKIKIILFILFSIFSCQPVEILDEVVFDYNQLPQISINAKDKFINEVYKINYVDPYIDHSIKNSPILRLNDWITQNISIFGSQNKIIINIIDASLKRIERKNKDKKKYQEKTEFFYEIHFLIEFELYDNNNFILATIKAETKRTTTTSKFISLSEKERILDTLILGALIDISIKSNVLLKTHMSEYLL
jgi:hypothetical protein|tara:strand:- start:2129 stop:2725 length:597 start_codon:yes stop_codon:yes gene_type:complete